tara:strand:+ start:3100 stop:3471 length:372 start_codon:yes stop_codon:yes gene_type:complete
MANTRVKDLIEQIKNTTDPDMLQILEFDLAEAMGRKDAGVKKPPVRKRSGGGSEMTDKQKKFAALAEPKDKITYADKLAGAGVKRAKGGGRGRGSYQGDEVLAANRCKGGGIAIKGTDFKGTF